MRSTNADGEPDPSNVDISEDGVVDPSNGGGAEWVAGPGVDRAPITRNVAQMVSSQAVTWLLATVLAIVQPRFLGPDGEGQIRLAASLWMMASVLMGLGTSLYLQLEIARRGREALDLIGPILFLRSIVFIFSSALLAVYVVGARAGSEFAALLILMGVGVLIGTYADTYLSAFVGLERMSTPAFIGVYAKLFGTVATVAVLVAGGDARSVVAVGVCVHVLSLSMFVRALRGIVRVELRVRRDQWRSILAASLGFMLATLAVTVYQQIDTVVMSVFVDATALGWYSTADVLAGTLLFLPVIVVSSIFPTLGRLHEQDPAGLHSLVRRTFSVLFLVAVPIGLGTLAVAQTVAPLLYGEDFTETGPVLAVLGVVLIPTTLTILFGMVAMSTGNRAFWTLLLVIAASLTIPLDIVLIPWMDRAYGNGAIGGALSYLVTELMMVVAGLVKIVPYLADRTTLWRVTRVTAAGGVMLAAVWPIRDRFFLLPVAVGASVYLLAVVLFRVVSDDERRLLRSATSSLRLGRSRSS